MYPKVRMYQLEITNTSLPDRILLHPWFANHTNVLSTAQKNIMLKPPWIAKEADVWAPVGTIVKLTEDAINGNPSYVPWIHHTIPCATDSTVICNSTKVFPRPTQM